MKWRGSRSIAMFATTANAQVHVGCLFTHGAGKSINMSNVAPLLPWRVAGVPVATCITSSLSLNICIRSSLFHPSAIPPLLPHHLHPSSLGSSCVALVHFDGSNFFVAAATHGARSANVDEAVDVLAKLVANTKSGTPTSSPNIGSAVVPNVGVAAELVRAAIDATPTLSPPLAARAEAVDVVAKLDARHKSATPTASRSPQAPGASFLAHPPHPPSLPFEDEASAQARQQSAAATTRAGSLAPYLRSCTTAHPIARRMRQVERDVVWHAGVAPRP